MGIKVFRVPLHPRWMHLVAIALTLWLVLLSACSQPATPNPSENDSSVPPSDAYTAEAIESDQLGDGGSVEPEDVAGFDSTDGLDTADSASQGLTESWEFGADTITVTVTTGEDDLRHYLLVSTHPMPGGGASERSYAEKEGDPLLRSGVLLTDALFAMAVEEARQNSVSQLSDGAFSQTEDCECYQTGEKWNWVWTRDIAYATELGLAWLNPSRAAASLLFKLSEYSVNVSTISRISPTSRKRFFCEKM